jgi:hypothetical protein
LPRLTTGSTAPPTASPGSRRGRPTSRSGRHARRRGASPRRCRTPRRGPVHPD